MNIWLGTPRLRSGLGQVKPVHTVENLGPGLGHGSTRPTDERGLRAKSCTYTCIAHTGFKRQIKYHLSKR